MATETADLNRGVDFGRGSPRKCLDFKTVNSQHVMLACQDLL